jgi:pentatricopeptide repeat protein
MAPSTYLYSLLMKGYMRTHNFPSACALLARMESSQDFPPNNVTYNTFVQCAMAAGEVREAREVFLKMPDRDIITYSIYLSGLFERGKLWGFLELVKEAMEVYE